MHPIMFQIGPLAIRYYGFMYMLAFIFSMVIAKAEIKRRKLNWDFDKLLDLMMYSFIMAIVGARAYYVAFSWDYYGKHLGDVVAVWKGGLAIHGGLIGAIIGIIIFSKMFKFNKWIVGDILILGTSLGQVFGRFGNFMNGDAHGIPTSLPWGVIFPAGTPAGFQFPNTPIHPVMLYEMVLDLLIFLILWKWRKADVKPGFISMLYFVLYSGCRFVVCFLRADSLMIGPYKVAQIVSVVTIVIAGSIIYSGRLWESNTL